MMFNGEATLRTFRFLSAWFDNTSLSVPDISQGGFVAALAGIL